ncbi:hypothetical protein BTS2_4022 [Bacillus sp. TS-2]|nr:hypothetical protein BTS2_4022 [Bacillus sp. TS-2]
MRCYKPSKKQLKAYSLLYEIENSLKEQLKFHTFHYQPTLFDLIDFIHSTTLFELDSKLTVKLFYCVEIKAKMFQMEEVTDYDLEVLSECKRDILSKKLS